jgi:hypothetical protein
MDDTVCQLGHRKWDGAIRTRAESLVFVVASVITSLRDDELTERAMVTKIIFSRSGHRPKTILLWKQEPTRQGGLHDGPAWPCIGALHSCKCRQPPATHQRAFATTQAR